MPFATQPPTRGPVLPRLVLTGPESSGKSVLAAALAEHLDGVLVSEYLRDYFSNNGALSLADAIPIAQGQWRREEQGAAKARQDGRVLICDTDLISSLVYSKYYYAAEINSPLWALWQAWAARHLARLKAGPLSPRLYILCGIDWPWVDDGQRDAPDDRGMFHALFQAALKQHGCTCLAVTGSLDERLGAVLAHLGQSHVRRG